MKFVKDKTTIIDYNQIQNQIRFVDDNYVLLEIEEDCTKYEYIEYFFNVLGTLDYKCRRRAYKYLSLDFNNQNKITKELICKLCASDPTTIITYYMTQGMSLQEAQYTYLNDRSVDIIEAAKCCTTYITSPKFIKTIITFLPIQEAERFIDEIREYSFKFRDSGHFGKKYGDKTNGIFDFIESYDIYDTPTGGLRGYTLNPGMNLQDFVNQLLDVLYNGNCY